MNQILPNIPAEAYWPLLLLNCGILIYVVWRSIFKNREIALPNSPLRRIEAMILVSILLPFLVVVVLPGRSVFETTVWDLADRTDFLRCVAALLAVAVFAAGATYLVSRKQGTMLACLFFLIMVVAVVNRLDQPLNFAIQNGTFQRSGKAMPRELEIAKTFSPTKDDLAQIKRLIDRARLDNYEPSKQWCNAFQAFGKHGWVELHEQIRQDPDLQRVVDVIAKTRFGIDDEMDFDEAWEALNRITAEVVTNGRYYSTTWKTLKYPMPDYAFVCYGRAVELLAPKLDPQQVVDALVVSVSKNQWPVKPVSNSKTPFNAFYPFRNTDDTSFTELRPLIHAAWEIDRLLNEQFPGEYNLIETELGDALFVRTPPKPIAYSFADVKRMFDPSGGSSRLETSLLDSAFKWATKYEPPVFGSPASDEFVRRQAQSGPSKAVTNAFGDQHLVSQLATQTGLSLRVGDEVKLGSATVNRWFHQLIFLDSPIGREYRLAHRKELLELAIRSVGPIESIPLDAKDRNLAQVVDALNSVFNRGASQSDQWPVPDHLRFLFLDIRGAVLSEPSLAMEFWPFLDAMLDTIPRLSDHDRLILRWNYLGQLGPESTADMFVESYLKAPSESRQQVLLGVYLANKGLPETLPVEKQLVIVERLKFEISRLPELPQGIYPQHAEERTDSELETILIAKSNLDCAEGAMAYLDLHEQAYIDGKFGLTFPPAEAGAQRLFDHLNLIKFNINGNTWSRRDDRVTMMANHDSPVLRRTAIVAIRFLPIPKFVPLLERLTKDSDIDVRDDARSALEELETLRGLLK